MAKYKVELNNAQNIRDLLQEAYILSNEQIVNAQNEINKMANATMLQDEIMEAKAKYGKMMNDYMSIKDKAIAKKIEIAKILIDVMHHNGNLNEDGDGSASGKAFDFNKIKAMVNEMHKSTDTVKTIELNKK